MHVHLQPIYFFKKSSVDKDGVDLIALSPC